LTITAKEVLTQRARRYRDSRALDTHKGAEGPKEHDLEEFAKVCDFSVLNNTMAELKDGERGLYCTRNTFTYSLVG